jgi:hypothetical protein
MNLGLLRMSRGEYGQALESLLESRSLSDELGLEPKRAAADLVLARTYQALNLDAEAAETSGQAVETLRRHEHLPFELANALLRNGLIAEWRGDLALARQNLTEARMLFARIGNEAWETMAQLAGLRVTAAEATRPALAPLLVEVASVSKRLGDLGSPDQAAAGYLLQGEIALRLGHHEPALASIHAARDIGEQISADGVLYQAYTAEGILLEADSPDEARAAFARAVEHLERLRAGARADDLKLAVVGQGVNLYERIARLLLGAVDAQGVEQRWREAFRWLERGKSRGLLEDALSGPVRSTNVTPRVQRARERVADLRGRLNAAYRIRFSVDAEPVRGAAALADDLEALERDLSHATRELQILLRGDRAVDVSALIDVERVQSALDPGTCLLEYVILDDEIACFVVRHDGFEVRRSIASRQAVEKAASWLWFHIRKGTYGPEFLRSNHATLARSVNQAIQQLGSALLVPVQDLLDGASHVVVVPHSLLHGVPIHALTYRDGILLDAMTVSYAPSAAVFAASADHGAEVPTNGETNGQTVGHGGQVNRPLIVAPDIPDLPWVADEARRIAALFPDAVSLMGVDATLEAVRSEARACDALHLATHGVFRSDNPTYSALELVDGWLSVGELAELSGGRALICLSACHMGMSGVGPGDELLGLTRAVLGSGAQALIASLWAANDDTAPAYMEALYAGLRAGKSRAESLRDAALQTRRREAHPYFWAPFILVGAP